VLILACSKASDTKNTAQITEESKVKSDRLALIANVAVDPQFAHPLVEEVRTGKTVSKRKLLDSIL